MNLNYDVPFKFTGKIDRVTIELKPVDQTSAEEAKKAEQDGTVKKGLDD